MHQEQKLDRKDDVRRNVANLKELKVLIATFLSGMTHGRKYMKQITSLSNYSRQWFVNIQKGSLNFLDCADQNWQVSQLEETQKSSSVPSIYSRKN
jgi:Ran GTPase-activating protein (RanGAP) involved in mRNA processing and transport